MRSLVNREAMRLTPGRSTVPACVRGVVPEVVVASIMCGGGGNPYGCHSEERHLRRGSKQSGMGQVGDRRVEWDGNGMEMGWGGDGMGMGMGMR